MNTNDKLREALIEIREAMMKDSGMGPTTELHTVIDMVTQECLAMPRRNCDVGTTDEQRDRFYKVIDSYRNQHGNDKKGIFEWLQLPYEEVK